MTNFDNLFTPVKNQRVYSQIVEQIIDLINRGDYQPGLQLPIEKDLAKIFGVSRPTLREALTVLHMMGLIETIPGQGTYITNRAETETSDQDLSRLLNDESPIMTIKARLAFEPAVASEAASHRSKEALRKLDEIVESVQTNPNDNKLHSDADRSFHMELAFATGNPVLLQMQTIIYELMGQKLWKNMISNTWGSVPTFWDDGLHEHQKILEAVRKKDAASAGKFSRDHLLRVQNVMVSKEISFIRDTSRKD